MGAFRMPDRAWRVGRVGGARREVLNGNALCGRTYVIARADGAAWVLRVGVIDGGLRGRDQTVCSAGLAAATICCWTLAGTGSKWLNSMVKLPWPPVTDLSWLW